MPILEFSVMILTLKFCKILLDSWKSKLEIIFYIQIFFFAISIRKIIWLWPLACRVFFISLFIYMTALCWYKPSGAEHSYGVPAVYNCFPPDQPVLITFDLLLSKTSNNKRNFRSFLKQVQNFDLIAKIKNLKN